MKIINLPIESTIPRIIMARKFQLNKNTEKANGRISTVYEVSYYVEANGNLQIDKNHFNIKPGDIRFVKPGTFLNSTPDYTCYTVNFDFGEIETIYSNQILDNIPEYISTDGKLKPFFEEIIKRVESSEPHDKIYQTALLTQIISSLYELTILKNPYSEPVKNCIDFLELNFKRQISLKDLGEFSGYSDIHLLRLFKKDTGRSPHDFITEFRINHAKKLLTSTEGSIETIAYECGFKSVSHFKTLFKEFTGLTPGSFRKNTTFVF